MKNYILALDEIDTLIKDIAEEFKSGVVVLRGDLAAGKTTFVKKMVAYLGNEEEVTSPTFSLQHIYSLNLFHYDMYNHGIEHFISLGMLEELERDGLHFVEWGDDTLIEILRDAEINVMSIDIEKKANNKREYKVCMY